MQVTKLKITYYISVKWDRHKVDCLLPLENTYAEIQGKESWKALNYGQRFW